MTLYFRKVQSTSYFILLVLAIALSPLTAFHLESKIKSSQQYKSSLVSSQYLYSISISRIASSDQSSPQSCSSTPKQIIVKTQKQLFRLVDKGYGQSKNRQQSIFEKITTLDSNQNIIQQFQIIGNQTFILTTNGKGHFLSQNGELITVDTGLNFTPTQQSQFFNIIIKNFKERALIITSNGISLCRSDQKFCVLLKTQDQLHFLINAEIFLVNSTSYLFLMTDYSLVIYQITAGNQLANKVLYNHQFFQTDKIHIRNVIKAKANQILFLDSKVGIYSITFKEKLSQFKTKKIVYEQPGCYQFSGNKQGDEIVLTCTLGAQSYFLQKLIRSYSFATPSYEAIETIFTREKIYGLAFAENFIMNRIYSGVHLYWTSNNIGAPYPYDYNNAGNIFLHNAFQSKLKILDNGQNIIYISTEDQIRQFTLRVQDPYVKCQSNVALYQQYKITYFYPCANPTPTQKICETQEDLAFSSWEYAEVKFTTMLIPLILSIIGVCVIVIILFRIYKNNKAEIERARLRYSIQNQFGM